MRRYGITATQKLFHLQILRKDFAGNQEGDILDTNSWEENQFHKGMARGFNRAREELLTLVPTGVPVEHLNQGPLEVFFQGKSPEFIVDRARIYRDIAWNLSGRSAQQLKMVRESVFEQVRMQKFENLPSRRSCIWITEEQHIPKWVETWYNDAQATGFKIFEITPRENGITHFADPYLVKDDFSYEEVWALALSYWEGTLTNPNICEILFDGRLELTKLVDEIPSAAGRRATHST